MFSEDRTRFYGTEITLAIEYLHQNGIVYRDLKVNKTLCIYVRRYCGRNNSIRHSLGTQDAC